MVSWSQQSGLIGVEAIDQAGLKTIVQVADELRVLFVGLLELMVQLLVIFERIVRILAVVELKLHFEITEQIQCEDKLESHVNTSFVYVLERSLMFIQSLNCISFLYEVGSNLELLYH